jgi:DNA-binding NtrC family response regulator
MHRLLIVDDERNVHYSFRRALEGTFEVLSAHDGEEALAALENDAPDVVLLDVKLPRLGGLETLEQIRDRYPNLPVIVMTAYGTVETAIRSTALAALPAEAGGRAGAQKAPERDSAAISEPAGGPPGRVRRSPHGRP